MNYEIRLLDRDGLVVVVGLGVWGFRGESMK